LLAKYLGKSSVLPGKEIKSEKIKRLIKRGEEKGFLTYDDVNDLLPSDVTSSDQIDDIIMLFGEKNIDIIDTDKRGKLVIKKQVAKSKAPVDAKVRKTNQDGDFIVYDNETVLDTRTNLMWAGENNEIGINWADAESYCENYRGGGYSDWRMPTLGELEGLYGSENYKNVIMITGWFVWASETSTSGAAYFDFSDGSRRWSLTSASFDSRALPVRSGK
jgi:hypothetical protein